MPPVTRSTVFSYHVSRLLNFLVTTLPTSMPNRSTIRCAKSGCDVPLNTLMLGILLMATFERVGTKSVVFTSIHLARMTSDDNKGILPRQASLYYGERPPTARVTPPNDRRRRLGAGDRPYYDVERFISSEPLGPPGEPRVRYIRVVSDATLYMIY